MMRLLAQVFHWLFGYGSYPEYLRSARWRELRKEALKRDRYRCRLCNSRWPLQVHHRRYATRWGEETVDDLTTLCDSCHDEVTHILRTRHQQNSLVAQRFR